MLVVSAMLSALSAGAAPSDMELHGYVEPCTIGNQQEMFTECELCSASHDAAQACEDKFGRKGYQKKCRTRGDAAGWAEVWCISTQPAKAAPPPEPPSPQPQPQRASKLLALLVAVVILGGGILAARAGTRRRPPS
jgi:hypothetical protein